MSSLRFLNLILNSDDNISDDESIEELSTIAAGGPIETAASHRALQTRMHNIEFALQCLAVLSFAVVFLVFYQKTAPPTFRLPLK